MTLSSKIEADYSCWFIIVLQVQKIKWSPLRSKGARKAFFILCVIFLCDLHSKPSAPPLRAHTAAPPPPDDFMNDDMDSYLIAMDTSIAPGPSNTGPPPPSLADDTRSKRPAAVSHKARIRIEEAEEEEEETDDLDRLPNKKVCLRFLRKNGGVLTGCGFTSVNQKHRSKIFSHVQKEADSLKTESSQLSTYSPHVKKNKKRL